MIIPLDQAIGLLIRFKYGVLLPATIIEGPMATIIAGLLAAHGYLNIFVSLGVVVVADIISDAAYYALGRWGHMALADRFKLALGITPERLERLQIYFRERGWQTFFAGKVLHGAGVAVLISAGAARVPFWQFLGYNIPVTIIKSLVLLLIGYYFGQLLRTFQHYLDIGILLSFGIASIIAIVLFIQIRRHQKDI